MTNNVTKFNEVCIRVVQCLFEGDGDDDAEDS